MQVGHNELNCLRGRLRPREPLSGHQEGLQDDWARASMSTIDLAIGDTAELFARVGKLFLFLRDCPVQAFDVGRDDVYRALSDAGCFDNDQVIIGALANT